MQTLLLHIALGLLLAAPAFGQAPPQAVVQQAAEAAIAQAFPGAAARLEVRVTRLGFRPEEPADGGDVQIAFRDGAEVPRGRAQVDVFQNDRKLGWALLHVAHFDSVLVTTRRYRSDEPIDVADLSVAYVETTRFRTPPLRPSDLTADGGTAARYATRFLKEGDVLTAGDLRPPFAADTGAAVRMTYLRHGLRLRLACKAREPGHVGDVIRLYAPDTDVTYRARLTAPGAAEWVETL